jgi:hypothetical protein
VETDNAPAAEASPAPQAEGIPHLTRSRRDVDLLSQASASVEFLREILELAQQVTAAERADDNGDLEAVSVLPDPNVGS